MKPINEIVAKYIGEEETAWQKHIKSQLNGRSLGDMDDEETKKFFAQAKKTYKGKMDEASDWDAKCLSACKLIADHTKDAKSGSGKEMNTQAKSMISQGGDYSKGQFDWAMKTAAAVSGG